MAVQTIDEFVDSVKLFLSDSTALIQNINEQIGTAASIIIKNRIQKTGINGNGKALGTYSKPYEKQRQKKNKLNNFVNLDFTGEMWRDFGVKETTITGNLVTTIVTARENLASESKVTTSQKMEFNAERYGDFLTLNPKEESELLLDFDFLLQQELDKYFK